MVNFVGFVLPAPNLVEQKILEFLKELLERTEGMGALELASFIFFNNLQSSLLGILLGFVFGIFPFLSSLFNGYVLGFVAQLSVKEKGALILWRLIPHGIFELPAVFISFGLGIKFGTFIFKKKKVECFWNYLWNSLRIFILIIVPLLIVAAIIEGILVFV